MNQNHPYASTAYEPFSSAELTYIESSAEQTSSNNYATRNAMQKDRNTANAVSSPVRAVLRIVALSFAVSIVVVQALAAARWSVTHKETIQNPSNGFRIRAWPAEMDLWPTWTNIIAGGIATIVHISALVTLFKGLSSLRKTKLYVAAVLLTSLLSIAALVAAAVYYKVDNARGKHHWDIWSWSCSPSRFANPVVDFKSLCTRLNYSFYALVVAGAIEIICLGIFLFLQIKDRKLSYRRIAPLPVAV